MNYMSLGRRGSEQELEAARPRFQSKEEVTLTDTQTLNPKPSTCENSTYETSTHNSALIQEDRVVRHVDYLMEILDQDVGNKLSLALQHASQVNPWLQDPKL